MQKGDAEQAVTWLNQAKKAAPYEPMVYMALVQAYSNLGALEKAEIALLNGLDNVPYDDSLNVVLARLYFVQEKWQKAARQFQRIQQLSGSKHYDQNIGKCYHNLGVTFAQKEEYEKARKYFKTSLDYWPENISAWKNFGFTSLAAAKLDQFDLSQVEMPAIDPGSGFPSGNNVYSEYSDKISGLVRLFEKIYALDPDDLRIGIALAELLFAKGDEDKGENMFRNLVKKHPKDRVCYERWLHVWHGRLNDEKIRTVLRLYIDQFSADKSLWQRLAGTYERKQEWQDARLVYRKALEYVDDSHLMFEHIARTFLQTCQYDSAAVIYRDLLKTDPQNITILERYAYTLATLKETHEALGIYRNMIRFNPFIDSPYIGMAKLYEKQGQLPAARNCYLKADSLGTQDPQAHFALYRLLDDEQFCIDYLKLAGFEILRGTKSNAHPITYSAQAGDSSLAGNSPLVRRKQQADSTLRIDIFRALQKETSSHEYINFLLDLLHDNESNVFLLDQIACWYYRQALYHKAISYYERVLDINDADAQSHYGVAQCWDRLGHFHSAAAGYHRVLDIDPENDDAFTALIALYDKHEKLDALCDKWLLLNRLRPSCGLVNYLTLALHKAGRHLEAKQEANHANP